jgi:hypothetical protein
MGLMGQLSTDPGYDLFAAVVWLARRTGGEEALTYAEVASEIHFGDDVDLQDLDSEEQAEDKKADETPEG